MKLKVIKKIFNKIIKNYKNKIADLEIKYKEISEEIKKKLKYF